MRHFTTVFWHLRSEFKKFAPREEFLRLLQDSQKYIEGRKFPAASGKRPNVTASATWKQATAVNPVPTSQLAMTVKSDQFKQISTRYQQ